MDRISKFLEKANRFVDKLLVFTARLTLIALLVGFIVKIIR